MCTAPVLLHRGATSPPLVLDAESLEPSVSEGCTGSRAIWELIYSTRRFKPRLESPARNDVAPPDSNDEGKFAAAGFSVCGAFGKAKSLGDLTNAAG